MLDSSCFVHGQAANLAVLVASGSGSRRIQAKEAPGRTGRGYKIIAVRMRYLIVVVDQVQALPLEKRTSRKLNLNNIEYREKVDTRPYYDLEEGEELPW
jgi:hypothetical protein